MSEHDDLLININNEVDTFHALLTKLSRRIEDDSLVKRNLTALNNFYLAQIKRHENDIATMHKGFIKLQKENIALKSVE